MGGAGDPPTGWSEFTTNSGTRSFTDTGTVARLAAGSAGAMSRWFLTNGTAWGKDINFDFVIDSLPASYPGNGMYFFTGVSPYAGGQLYNEYWYNGSNLTVVGSGGNSTVAVALAVGSRVGIHERMKTTTMKEVTIFHNLTPIATVIPNRSAWYNGSVGFGLIAGGSSLNYQLRLISVDNTTPTPTASPTRTPTPSINIAVIAEEGEKP
jgi:hypothetical protein